MEIGVTLVFSDKTNNSISGILKSCTVNTSSMNFKQDIESHANKIAEFYSYKYLGINDVFAVSGKAKVGEVLGRITYYDIDTLPKAKKLIRKDMEFLGDSNKKVSCSLLFFSKDLSESNITISIKTLLLLEKSKLSTSAYELANSNSFKGKIIDISVDGIRELQYVGIEDFQEADLKFNVFETYYSDFSNINELLGEILKFRYLKSKLLDVFKIKN